MRKSEETITRDNDGISYERRFPLWLRIFLLPWVLPCIPFILFYLDSAQSVDWAGPPVAGAVLATVGLVILPLGLSGLLLGYALLGAGIELRLDSRSAEAILRRQSPLRTRVTRYPLAAVRIAKVELKAYHPANDAAIITLKMPDGVTVKLGGFFRDEDARHWAEDIRTRLTAAPKDIVPPAPPADQN